MKHDWSSGCVCMCTRCAWGYLYPLLSQQHIRRAAAVFLIDPETRSVLVLIVCHLWSLRQWCGSQTHTICYSMALETAAVSLWQQNVRTVAYDSLMFTLHWSERNTLVAVWHHHKWLSVVWGMFSSEVKHYFLKTSDLPGLILKSSPFQTCSW